MTLDDHNCLHETANRLTKALGVEMAIQVCRSNYWSGVLRIILEQKDLPTAQTGRAISPLSPHCRSNAPYEMDLAANHKEIAKAA